MAINLETTDAARAALQALMDGNERFAKFSPVHSHYDSDKLVEIAQQQRPIAAVVACADSRVTPEIVFDQPLGAVFCARVPGNVAADSAVWMVDIAVSEFKVPLVLVVGHTGCLAVSQVVHGTEGTVGSTLKSMISQAVFRARVQEPMDVLSAALVENVKEAVDELPRRCLSLHRAIHDGATRVHGALYNMETGRVKLVC